MRIADVCAFYTPHGGGVRTYVEQKLASGPRLGHDVTIIAPGKCDETIEYGPAARIRFVPSPLLPLDRKYRYFADEPALHRALDEANPELVEVASPWRSPLMVARWPRDVPRTLVMHCDPLSAYAYRWLQPMFQRASIDRQFGWFWAHLRRLGDRFDAVICASEDLTSRLRHGGVRGAITIPMGVEPGLFSARLRDPSLRDQLLQSCDFDSSAQLLVAVGRLSPEKRWPLVIDAVAAAARHRPIGLALFGQGRDRRNVLPAIGGNPHIRLFQPEYHRPTFARVLASADALIHGCEAETFCMAAAEARASGIPVIVPDCGGAKEHAASGNAIYAAGDARSACSAILRVLGAPFRGESNRSRTSEDHFRDLFEHYEDLRRNLRMVA